MLNGRKKALNVYRHGKKSSYGGMSQHDVTMAIFKEMRKNLEVCNAVFVNRKTLDVKDFLNKKGATLSKVCKCATYMLETADRSADKETVDIYDQIYIYIRTKSLYANKNLDHEAVKQALFMAKELITIWDMIPEELR